MRRYLIMAVAAAAAVALPAAAQARPGFANTNVNMRAGPGTNFPVVDTLPAGAGVNIHGCLRGYTWCDVGWRGERGWVSGRYLEFAYRGRRVLLPEYAPEIGFPIVTFAIGPYWDNYYRNRYFYHRRGYFERYYHGHYPRGYYHHRRGYYPGPAGRPGVIGVAPPRGEHRHFHGVTGVMPGARGGAHFNAPPRAPRGVIGHAPRGGGGGHAPAGGHGGMIGGRGGGGGHGGAGGHGGGHGGGGGGLTGTRP